MCKGPVARTLLSSSVPQLLMSALSAFTELLQTVGKVYKIKRGLWVGQVFLPRSGKVGGDRGKAMARREGEWGRSERGCALPGEAIGLGQQAVSSRAEQRLNPRTGGQGWCLSFVGTQRSLSSLIWPLPPSAEGTHSAPFNPGPN